MRHHTREQLPVWSLRIAPSKFHSTGQQPAPVKRQSSRRGAAAVEFAMVAPIIFLLLFSTIEFGRALMAIHGLETAAREGCREAVSWDPSTDNIQQTVADRLTPFGISGYTLTLDPATPQSADQWDPVTVKIDVPYAQVSWLPLPQFLQDLTLSSSCTLPQESNHDE